MHGRPPYTLVVVLKYLMAAALCAAACLAQNYEIGGAIGYGIYRDGTIYAPGGDAQAGIRNRFAAGAGVKGYVVAGPAPFPQPLPNIASIAVDEWKPAASLGGGVKFRLSTNVVLRGDFLDYLTAFPKLQILPAPHGTARGIFEQFTPLFGVSYTF